MRIANMAMDNENVDVLDRVQKKPVDSSTADSMMVAYTASQRSPLAALGYDPRVLTISPKEKNEDVKPNIGGLFIKGHDKIWTTGQYDSTIVHESLHRGMEKLRKANMLPKEASDIREEYLVRAFMAKHFGDVEMGRGEAGDKQVASGKKVIERYSKILDKIEESAAALQQQERRSTR
jgi:hypothetical protein